MIKLALKYHVWDLPFGASIPTWNQIAVEVMAGESAPLKPSGRTCQIEYYRCIQHQRDLEKTHESRSGDVEPFEETEQLLHDCIELTDAHRAENDKKKAQLEEDKIIYNRLANHAMTISSKRRLTPRESPAIISSSSSPSSSMLARQTPPPESPVSTGSSSSSSSSASPRSFSSARFAPVVMNEQEDVDEPDVDDMKRPDSPINNKRVRRDNQIKQYQQQQREMQESLQKTAASFSQQMDGAIGKMVEAQMQSSSDMVSQIANMQSQMASMQSQMANSNDRNSRLLEMLISSRSR
jgi:hypothetical protein